MSSATPGPWVVEVVRGNHGRDCGLSILQRLPGYRGEVAHLRDAENIGGVTVAERNYNACLIAAAPDLLSMAKVYANSCSRCAGTGRIEFDEHDYEAGEACRDCADIRAVIDKAEGRA